MNGNPWTQEELDFLRKKYSRLSLEELSAALGRTPYGIRRKANVLGIMRRKGTPRPYKGAVAPLGHERPDSLGYIFVKVANRKWVYKHILNWTQHYGEPPAGPLEFIDGDKTNCEIGNLRLTTRAAQLRKNSVVNMPQELQQVIRIKGIITRMIKKRTEI